MSVRLFLKERLKHKSSVVEAAYLMLGEVSSRKKEVLFWARDLSY